MFENDYVMRMIHLLVQAIARLAGLKRNTADEETIEGLLEQTCGELLGFDLRLLHVLGVDDLLVMAGEGREGRARVMVMAELIRERALQMQRRGETAEAMRLNAKALALYPNGSLDELSLPEGGAVLLMEMLKSGADVPTAHEVAAYLPLLLKAGRFAQAEDVLFLALDRPLTQGERAVLLAAGEGLYDTLERLEDAKLTAGGLPRSELCMGRRALAALCCRE